MCSVTFDLLIRRDGAKDDFGELALVEGTVGDATGLYLLAALFMWRWLAQCAHTQPLPMAS